MHTGQLVSQIKPAFIVIITAKSVLWHFVDYQ